MHFHILCPVRKIAAVPLKLTGAVSGLNPSANQLPSNCLLKRLSFFFYSNVTGKRNKSGRGKEIWYNMEEGRGEEKTRNMERRGGKDVER